jgi:magnesium-transporting ATPase (P-type)
MSGCCGMSLLLNFKTHLNNIFFKNKIEGVNFILLNFTVFVMSLSIEFIDHQVKKKNRFIRSFVSTCLYFVGWVIMMLSMTANFYLILTIVLAKFTVFYLFRNYEKSEMCC